MNTIRVLLADSQPVFLDGLRAHAELAGDLAVVATAGTGADAIARAVEHRPDVLVLDIRMPGTDGIAVTRRLRDETPEIAVLMLTEHREVDQLGAAMSAGAAGYVTKHAEPPDVLTAIRVVARGGLVVNAAIAPEIRRFLGTSRAPGMFPQLSVRERDVLDLLVRDTATAAIARQLGISMKTVRNHISNILVKLPARTRAEAARIAREAGPRVREIPRPAISAGRGTGAVASR
jgi:DNA-binding NarL/FixJ family response regulator